MQITADLQDQSVDFVQTHCILWEPTTWKVLVLIEFSVDNFRSIKDNVTLSMVSTPKNKMNAVQRGKFHLHTSAVIYGANSSGKSNILRAFDFMKRLVLNLDKVIQSTDELAHDPFLLSTTTAGHSSMFEVSFLVDETKYRYGFEADKSKVYSEWLYLLDTGRSETQLFYRDADEQPEIKVNESAFKEGMGLKALPNTLFLWKCDQEGSAIAKTILTWFKSVNLLNGMRYSAYGAYSTEQVKNNDAFRARITELVESADFGISGIRAHEQEVSENDLDELAMTKKHWDLIKNRQDLKRVGIKTLHKVYDEDLNEVRVESFDLDKQESDGTNKFFCLTAPFIDTINHGMVLLVDELDASLHPLLTIALVSMFNDPEVNTKGAQLVFISHDTNLLNQSLFYKSQIWFAEKDRYGATHLNSLDQYKGIRKVHDIEKHYIQGQFGAVPFLGDFKKAGKK